jgi:type III secretion system YscJ/HrcJ family lipoprotein
LVATVCLCALLLIAGTGGCDQSNTQQELTKVDSEKEANRVLVELEAHGIRQAQKVEKSEQRKVAFSITVPAGELSAARSVLVQCDLPREPHGGFASIAESSSLIPTKNEERAKLIHALSGELERTFETYDRVVSARVHIVLPEKDPLASRDATTKPTASAMVLIKYTAQQPTEGGESSVASTAEAVTPNGKPSYTDAPVAMQEVQQMVARSVEGLTPQNVFVTFTKSAARPVVAAAAATMVSTNGTPTTGPAESGTAGAGGGGGGATGAPADKKLMMQLFGACAVFGLVAILLTAMLVREKRKQRAVPASA